MSKLKALFDYSVFIPGWLSFIAIMVGVIGFINGLMLSYSDKAQQLPPDADPSLAPSAGVGKFHFLSAVVSSLDFLIFLCVFLSVVFALKYTFSKSDRASKRSSKLFRTAFAGIFIFAAGKGLIPIPWECG